MEGHTPARRGTRRALLAVAGAVVGGSLVMTAAAAPRATADADSDALSILLTNDDGWDAPGITAVYDALVGAGHEVTMVAPATNQSGSGARATFRGPMVVGRPEPGKYTVEGSPADAAEFGLSVVFEEEAPDVVISGTNAGQNIAAAAVHSGTVGAAVTAINEGVPAIAISSEVSASEQPFDATADFLVDLLDELDQHRRRGALLPAGAGLNVNYPVVDGGGEPAGVELTRTGTGFLDLDYSGAELPAVGEASTFSTDIAFVPETVRNADATALEEDKVSVAIITGNYDLDARHVGRVRAAVHALD